MSAPVQIRSLYSHLFTSAKLPVLREMFMSELALKPSLREQLFRIESTDQDIYQVSERHDMGMFVTTSEGSEITRTRPLQGASKTFSISKFALATSLSQELIDDAKFSVIAESVKQLARSAQETQQIAAMNVFNNGFVSETTADGVALFSTSHTLPSGGTYRSRVSSDADLSVTTLDQMLTDFSTQFVSDGGKILHIKPKILLVAPSNERYAKELIGSDLKADTAENNMNSFKEDGLRVIVSPHLSDADATFLLGAPEDTGLRIIKRKAIELEQYEEKITQSTVLQSSYREALGAAWAWGVMGNRGA